MPSYVQSQAKTGLGTTLSIGDGESPETFTPFGEIKSLSQSGRQANTDDVTNLSSSAKEFITTLVDSGEWDFTCNRVGGDAGQVALESAFNGLETHNFKIQFPKSAGQTTSGDSFTFAAVVTELSYSVAPDKAQTFTGKIKVSGLLNFVAGS
jgi:hypothetical protein